MIRHVAIPWLLAGCGDHYLLVSVEGADLELTVAPAKVRVAVYADRERIDFDFTSRLEPRAEGGVPATDFVLVTDNIADLAQLRISIPTTTTTWFSDARVNGEGTIHLPLFAGERPVTTASFVAGDLDTSALFGPGIVMAWVDSGGVQTRVEKDPDRLISRQEMVAADPSATKLRLASRQNPLGYGPDLYGVAWIGGDGMARLRTSTLTSESPVRALGVVADDLAIGAASKGATFAIAVVVRTGDSLTLKLLDEAGLPLAADKPIASGATTIVGVAVTRDGIAIGWRANDGSHLALIGGNGGVTAGPAIDGDLVGLSTTNDGSRLLSLQRRGLSLFQVSYFPNLTPTDIDIKLGTTIVGGRTSLSGCIAAWPELRADGSNVTDLRFAILDENGNALGEPHLINVEETGDHLAPTVVCASQTRAYATFFEHAAATDPGARLRIRRIPTY